MGVPSFSHEILVELFRQRPLLATDLLACAGIRIEGVTVERGSIDLTQVVPTEYRSDAVTVLRDEEGEAIAAVIVEVQLSIDEDKRRTWPLYVAAARASYGCPATLLVFAPERAVARWARRVIDLGHPGFALRPIVLAHEDVPRISDAASACATPELAVLSAMSHPDLVTAEAAYAALPGLPEDLQELYWDVILSGLPELARQTLEARMIKGYQFQSDFARKYVARGREEGLAQGREEGLARGLEALRQTIVEIVCGRFPGLRDELASRLRGRPEAWLTTIAVELSKARDEEEVRAILGQRP